MSVEHPRGIRVTLHWIQISDTKEPVWKDRGHFRFTAVVTAGASTTRTLFPEEGDYEITDQPGWNRVIVNRVIFAGDPGGGVTIEIHGEEIDRATDNDELELYRRSFSGSPGSWIGSYEETMSDWQVSYSIEAEQAS